MTNSEPSETPVHVQSDQARGGETRGRMRYVLGISILLAIGILSLIVWGPVLFDK